MQVCVDLRGSYSAETHSQSSYSLVNLFLPCNVMEAWCYGIRGVTLAMKLLFVISRVMYNRFVLKSSHDLGCDSVSLLEPTRRLEKR